MTKQAADYLIEGARVLNERGASYDANGTQERSMQKIVAAFNTITNQDLSEAQGWAFMQVLKLVRLHATPNAYQEDSAIDGINYAALAAECGAKTSTDLHGA